MESGTHEVAISIAEAVTVDREALALMERAVVAVLEGEGASPSEVSLHLTDDGEIERLNSAYRGVEQPTDVLSFPLEGEDVVAPFGDAPRLLGDIIVSVERAAAQAEEYGHSFERELAFLAVHGTLHLLGYDHEHEDERRVMREREEAILTELGLTRE